MRPLIPARRSKRLAPFLRAAFWSGNLPEKKWRHAIKDPAMAHKAILKTSFEHMPVSVLLGELGEKAFVRRWPEIRKLFPQENEFESKRLLLFDSTWGILAAGDSQYPVSGKVAALSKGRLDLLREIVSHPGISIYALSRKTDRQYARVFKEVKLLADLHLVEIRADQAQGRKLSRLYSRESINTRLAEACSRQAPLRLPGDNLRGRAVGQVGRV